MTKQSFQIASGLLLVFAALLPQTAHAGEDDSTISVKVPQKYQGYHLRVSGKPYELEPGSVKIPAVASRRRVELSDENNRLMADSFTKVGPNTVSNLRERPFHIGAEAGFGFESGSKLEKLRAEGASYHTGLNFVYRPTAFGLMLNHNYHRYDGVDLYSGPSGYLSSHRTGLAGVYEWAPIGRGPLFFARLHFAFMAGVVWANHEARIAEDDVKLRDSARTLGPQGAVELRIPLAVNLWLSLRESYQRYDLKMNKLNFDETVEELNSSVGLRYAF